MTEEEQNPNINTILEPIDIDLDKLFSLSYTFDNLKSFMKNILKNQQIIADKIKDLEKKSSTQNEENKKFHIFQIKIDKKLKVVENNVNKTKKAIENVKTKLKEEDTGANVIEEKDVTESDEKDEKEEKGEKDENEAQEKRRSIKKRGTRTKRKSTETENQFSFNEITDEKEEEDEYNYENMPSNKDITEIKERLNNFDEKINELTEKINQQKNNNMLTLKPTDFAINDKNSDIELIKLEIKSLKENNETFKVVTDSIKKKVEDISVKVMDFDVYDLFKDSSVGGGSVDASKVLIKNLEQKFTHKTEIIDEKMKKMRKIYIN